MESKEFETAREKIYYSYANLAMAHTAIDRNQSFTNNFSKTKSTYSKHGN